MNKKAQAQIITTILIILLVIAAIVIVWVVVRGVVKSGSTGISRSVCFQEQAVIEKINTGGDEVTVSRGSGVGNLTAKIFISVVGKSSKRTTNALKPLESETVSFAQGTIANGDIVKAALVFYPDTEDEIVCDFTDEKVAA